MFFLRLEEIRNKQSDENFFSSNDKDDENEDGNMPANLDELKEILGMRIK